MKYNVQYNVIYNSDCSVPPYNLTLPTPPAVRHGVERSHSKETPTIRNLGHIQTEAYDASHSTGRHKLDMSKDRRRHTRVV